MISLPGPVDSWLVRGLAAVVVECHQPFCWFSFSFGFSSLPDFQ